jgi:dienelactone hydrolase
MININTFKKTLQWLSVVVFFLLFVVSCGSNRSVQNRIISADNILLTSKLQPVQLKTPYFSLHAAYHSPKRKGLLNIYIEGDGRSWVSRYQLSSNPTPINPVALRLAIIHADKNPNENIAWIARPCQYLPAKRDVNCESKYWSSHRFSEKVIQSTNDAIDQLVQKSGATSVRLVGFSGGAAVAVLVAARRDDIDSVVTIAGNLDHKQVNEYHGVTPLLGSLNPKDVVDKIKYIPQVHFIGSDDEVIPVKISTDFIRAKKGLKDACAKQVVVPSVGHINGWTMHWPMLSSSLGDQLTCE